MKTVPLLACALHLLAVVGCGVGTAPLAGPPQGPDSPPTLDLPPPVIARLQQQVRPDIERYVAAQQASTIQALSRSKAFPAAFKLPLVVRRLSAEERQFLFEHAASLAEHFFPYFERLDGQTRPQAEADRRFCHLVSERLDY